MEELETDKLSGYDKNQENLDSNKNSEDTCAALLNGSDETDDPLDLMDNCDNVSLGSNSDVWKGSDSEDDTFEGKDNSNSKDDTNNENEGKTDTAVSGKENNDKTAVAEDKNDGAVEKSSGKTKQNAERSSVVANKENVEAEEVENTTVKQVKEKKKLVKNTDTKDDADTQIYSQSSDKQKTGNTVGSCDENQTGTDAKTAENVPMETDVENLPEAAKREEPKPPAESSKLDENHSAKEVDNDSEEKSVVGKPVEITEKSVEDKPLDVNEKSVEEPNAKSADKDLSADKPSEATTTEDKNPLTGDGNQDFAEPGPPSRYNDGDDECQMDYDAEEDDDFDPSLLCPEVSMAVDDNPVVTTNGGMPNDECDSPLPYEPVFSTFVDEVTGAEISFNLTTEEQELRKRLYGPTNPIQITRIHCTACNVHLGSALEGQNNRFVHPLLKVMICKECYHFYTSGEFEKDEDGSELYCRWCGQGGQVLCCSKCEYVFCKRCIRTNFGRKKMFEIRDSDSWDCFRCNTQQIVTQRVACYEFFEYVRREMQRASTLNSPEIWSKDHTRCCHAKKRALESWDEIVSRVKKPKKRKCETDPDYNPLVDKPKDPLAVVPTTPPSTSNVQFGMARKMMMTKPSVQIVSRFNRPQDNDIEFVRQIPAPHVTIGTAPRPAYRTILPSSIRPAIQPTLLRISSQPVPPLVPTSNRLLSSALHGRNVNSSNMMKHEWFEKTVRAAARVNSHLSYTLTQLNKAQSQAASVEELAVVHNKLQEILSSSINSLIQIRKNLRTEFIAGIKTVRLPSKKVDNSFSNDDDVIFVSAPPVMPVPSTSAVVAPPKDPLIIIDHSTPTTIQGISVKPLGNIERPKGGYLKVKSVMELQNVPSECITIPDDSPTPPKATKAGEKSAPTSITCNGASDTSPSKEVDPLAGTPGAGHASGDTVIDATIKLSEVPNDKTNTQPKEQSDQTKDKEEKTQRSEISKIVYNMKEEPTADIKRMLTVKVNLQNENLEELQKRVASKTE